jgi:hypothetical protein
VLLIDNPLLISHSGPIPFLPDSPNSEGGRVPRAKPALHFIKPKSEWSLHAHPSRSPGRQSGEPDKMRYTPSAPVHGVLIQPIISHPRDRVSSQ